MPDNATPSPPLPSGWRSRAGYVVDLRDGTVREPDGLPTTLTPLEVEALRVLIGAGGLPVRRETLATDVWGHRAGARSEAVPVAMRRLRSKVGADLETVRGVGWRLVPAVAEEARPADGPWMARPALREALVDALERWSWAAVVGAPGMGRTRMVKRALEAPALWVSLGRPAGSVSAEAVWEALAGRLRMVSDEPGAVRSALAARGRPTVVLDDLASLADDAVAAVRQLAGVGPVVTISVEAPTHGGVVQVGPLTPAESQALAELLGATLPPEVFAACDGVPAMLVMAAANAWQGPELAGMAAREVAPRRVLQALFERRTPQERTVLQRMTAWGGRIPRDAASQLLDARALRGLVAGSWVHADGSAWRLLGPHRDFLERVDEGDATDAHRAMVGFAEGAPSSRELDAPLLHIAQTGEASLAARAAWVYSQRQRVRGVQRVRHAVVLAALAKVAADDPLARALQIERARTELAMGAPARAIEALDSSTETAAVAHLRALCHLQMGHLEAAVDALNRVVDDPDASPGLRAVARVHRHTGALVRRAQPWDDLEVAQKMLPEAAPHWQAEVLRASAMIALRHGERSRARAWVSRGLDIAEEHALDRMLPRLWSTLGITICEDVDAAVQAQEHALELTRASGEHEGVIATNLGLLYFVQRRPQEALDLLAPIARRTDAGSWQAVTRWVCWMSASALGQGRRAERYRAQVGAEDLATVNGSLPISSALMQLGFVARALHEAPDSEAVQTVLTRIEPVVDGTTSLALRVLVAFARRE